MKVKAMGKDMTGRQKKKYHRNRILALQKPVSKLK